MNWVQVDSRTIYIDEWSYGMEAYSGGIVGPVKKVLQSKGYSCIGAKELKMTSSMSIKPTNSPKLLQRHKKAISVLITVL